MSLDPSELRTSALMRRCAQVMKAAVPGVQRLADELIARAALLDQESEGAVVNPGVWGPAGQPCACTKCNLLANIKEIFR